MDRSPRFSNFREKRPRAAKPESFIFEDAHEPLDVGENDWPTLDEEKLYNFLTTRPDVILILHKGRINQKLVWRDLETYEQSIMRCSLGHSPEGDPNRQLIFAVQTKIGEDGACPFDLSPPDANRAGKTVTFYAYVTLSRQEANSIDAEFILELEDLEFEKPIDERLKRFVVRDFHRNVEPRHEEWHEPRDDSETVGSRSRKRLKAKSKAKPKLNNEIVEVQVQLPPDEEIIPHRDLQKSLPSLRDSVRQELMLEMGPAIRLALKQAYDAKFQAEKQEMLRRVMSHVLSITSEQIINEPRYELLKQEAIKIASESLLSRGKCSACGLTNDKLDDDMPKSP